MEHTRTTPEQSVILKKIGYDVPSKIYYNKVSETRTIISGTEENYPINWNKHDGCWSRPKLTDVATWLRTVHGWHVAVIAGHKHRIWTYIATDDDGHTYRYDDTDERRFHTHDLALSAGIDFILNKLNEDDTHPTNQNSRIAG